MADILAQLDLTPGSLLRSGSFVVSLALAALLWARRESHEWNRRLAVVYLLTGVGGLAYNIIGANTTPADALDPDIVVPTFILTSVNSVLCGVATWPIVAGLIRSSPDSRPLRAAVAFGGLLAVLHLVYLVGTVAQRSWFGLESLAYSAGKLLPIAVGLVAATETLRATTDRPARGETFWIAFFPLWAEALLYTGSGIADAGGEVRALGPSGLVLGALIVAWVGTRLAVTLWGLRATASRTVLVLCLACLAVAAAHAVLGQERAVEVGVSGMLLVGAFVAAMLLMARQGFFGGRTQEGPRLRVGRGLVAPLGLAALFITAQFVQNFASSKFSLVTGAVVAGLAVLLAYPLQRAAERAMERPGKRGARDEYRALVAHAWSDGNFGPKERLMLSETRRRLGLGAEAAQAIEDEVARGVRRAD